MHARGPVLAILTAPGGIAAGCLLMLIAADIAVHPLVHAGLFVLASGVTLLQVAPNPQAAALGDPARSHFRRTFSQTFNLFGTFIGPLLGAQLFLAGLAVSRAPGRIPPPA